MGKTEKPSNRQAQARRGLGDIPADERGRQGQALVEFAIVLPVFLLVITGIIQFGLIFWSQNTLTQVARDTGRWAATQTECKDSGAIASVTQTANSIAANSSLLGYGTAWVGSGSDTGSVSEVVVSWDAGLCPPTSNQEVSFVTVQIDHQIPIFFPFVPGGGNLTTTAEFRMEPEPL